jgi:hypothetical protein
MEDIQTELVIFQESGQPVEVRLDGLRDTVWLSQTQMVTLFGRDQSVVSRHIGNVFKEGELERESNMQKMHTANSDKPVELYNLNVIISVGYRVKSQQGTRLRQWATRILREHLTQGYTLNRQRFKANAQELEAALKLVRKAAQSPELRGDDELGLVRVVGVMVSVQDYEAMRVFYADRLRNTFRDSAAYAAITCFTEEKLAELLADES